MNECTMRSMFYKAIEASTKEKRERECFDFNSMYFNVNRSVSMLWNWFLSHCFFELKLLFCWFGFIFSCLNDDGFPSVSRCRPNKRIEYRIVDLSVCVCVCIYISFVLLVFMKRKHLMTTALVLYFAYKHTHTHILYFGAQCTIYL